MTHQHSSVAASAPATVTALDSRRDPIDVALRDSRASGDRLNSMIARLEHRVEANRGHVPERVEATTPLIDAAATAAEVSRSRSRLEHDLPRLAADLASLQSRVAAAAGALDDANAVASLAIALEEICNPIGMLSEESRCELAIASDFLRGRAHVEPNGDFVFSKAGRVLNGVLVP